MFCVAQGGRECVSDCGRGPRDVMESSMTRCVGGVSVMSENECVRVEVLGLRSNFISF